MVTEFSAEFFLFSELCHIFAPYRFLHLVFFERELNGNAVQVGNSSRCCKSRFPGRGDFKDRYLLPLTPIVGWEGAGKPHGDKSEDLPVTVWIRYLRRTGWKSEVFFSRFYPGFSSQTSADRRQNIVCAGQCGLPDISEVSVLSCLFISLFFSNLPRRTSSPGDGWRFGDICATLT